jgi:hypothetical protein
MELIGAFVARLFTTVGPVADWALRNWLPTMVILVALIFWAGHQRRIHH